MQFTAAVASLALAAGVSAYSNSTGTAAGPAYVTEVVTAYTTYCPAATMITHGSKTYTVTEATTLTITDCPCTITKPVAPVPTPMVPVVAPVYPNGTATTSAGKVPGAASPSGSAVTSKPAAFTGAASANTVSGAAVAAFGLAAFFL